MTGAGEYRVDHYYILETPEEHEEGHIFCTPNEGVKIQSILRKRFPDVSISVEPGGEYDYSTEEDDAEIIAESIIHDSGFRVEEEE